MPDRGRCRSVACYGGGRSRPVLNGKPERLQQRAALVVGLGGRHHGDVEAADAVDLVLVDLVEHGLLRETEGVVAVAVELARRTGRGSRGCGAARARAGGRGTPTRGRRAASRARRSAGPRAA